MTPPNKPKLERTWRLTVFLSAEDLAAINDFRFRAKMPSLAATVRELLRLGLASPEKHGKDRQRDRLTYDSETL